jgi:hypothetical protein
MQLLRQQLVTRNNAIKVCCAPFSAGARQTLIVLSHVFPVRAAGSFPPPPRFPGLVTRVASPGFLLNLRAKIVAATRIAAAVFRRFFGSLNASR